jgi:hypothetical protein
MDCELLPGRQAGALEPRLARQRAHLHDRLHRARAVDVLADLEKGAENALVDLEAGFVAGLVVHQHLRRPRRDE